MLLYHVFCCENILWTWLNKWVRQCRASTIQSGSVCFELSLSVLHHVYICDTGSCTPSAGMDVGGGPYLHLKCEYWLLMSIWNSNPIHIFRGGSYTHDSKNLKLYFISFVSSNWVVINHQKGEDCKCNQALCGFHVDDHLIRDLMRYIEMTCRKLERMMMYRLEDPLFHFWGTLNTWRPNYFLFWILSLGKTVLLRGIREQLVKCRIKCSNQSKFHHPRYPKQPAKFQIVIHCFGTAALPRVECGT